MVPSAHAQLNMQHINQRVPVLTTCELYMARIDILHAASQVEHAALWKLAVESMSLGSHCMLRNLNLSRCSLTEGLQVACCL